MSEGIKNNPFRSEMREGGFVAKNSGSILYVLYMGLHENSNVDPGNGEETKCDL